MVYCATAIYRILCTISRFWERQAQEASNEEKKKYVGSACSAWSTPDVALMDDHGYVLSDVWSLAVRLSDGNISLQIFFFSLRKAVFYCFHVVAKKIYNGMLYVWKATHYSFHLRCWLFFFLNLNEYMAQINIHANNIFLNYFTFSLNINKCNLDCR